MCFLWENATRSINSCKIDARDWVLRYHENLSKLESKWFESYQVMKRIMLSIYRLQDSNDVQLASLRHGNRFLNAKIHLIDKLCKLWAASSIKDQLWWCNKVIELMLSDGIQNMKLLEYYLFNDDNDDLVWFETIWTTRQLQIDKVFLYFALYFLPNHSWRSTIVLQSARRQKLHNRVKKKIWNALTSN